MEDRHALTQTVAAEQLEGWQPTAGEIAALSEFLSGALTFGEYLAPHLGLPRTGVRHPLLARRQPYLIPGTAVLRNNFGLVDAVMLARLEFIATAARIGQVHLRIGQWTPEVRQLHQHVFGDVYPWAGEPRIVELRRGDSAFLDSTEIPKALRWLSSEIAELDDAALTDDALVFQLARIYSEYNRIHPFREGNGRTGTLLLHLLAYRAGRRLDLCGITRADWIAASRNSMRVRSDGRVDPRPLAALLQGAVCAAVGR